MLIVLDDENGFHDRFAETWTSSFILCAFKLNDKIGDLNERPLGIRKKAIRLLRGAVVCGERYPAKFVISPDVPIGSIVKNERSVMNRFLMTTAVALLMGMAPAIAAEDSNLPAGNQSQSEAGNLPTQSGVTPEVSKQATEPSDGTADKSGGAAERSSAPPASGAASADEDASKAAQSSDTSAGAKEQSSAPEGSSAADKSKPNPTIGSESSSKDDQSSKE